MWLFFLEADGSAGLTGSKFPSFIVYCTRSVENVFPVMHLVVWATMRHDARRRDDQAPLFFFSFLSLCNWKRWMKTRASSRDVCALNLPTEYLIWIGLTDDIRSEITVLMEHVFSTPSIMHALYWSMLKYYHVVNEAKTVQRVCGNWLW